LSIVVLPAPRNPPMTVNGSAEAAEGFTA